MPSRREIDLTDASPPCALGPAAASDPAAARRAIVGDWAANGVAIHAAHLVLAASRSHALAMALAAICEPHDVVLAPAPCDPRVRRLAALAGVHLTPVPPSSDEGAPALDVAAIYEAIGERTRAIVLASPSPATGAMLTRELAEALSSLGIPLICDETAARTRLDPGERLPSLLAQPCESPALVIGALEGALASPGAQLGWIAVAGPDDARVALLERLREIAAAHDAVPPAITSAVPELLAGAASPRSAIAERCARNLAALRAAGLEVPAIDGGWSACVRLPGGRDDVAGARQIREAGVRVDPGSDYGFDPDEGWIVVSLLAAEPTFAAALARITALTRPG